jgi:protein TonB
MFDTLLESRPHTALGLSRWGLAFAITVHGAAIAALLRPPAPSPEAPTWIDLGIEFPGDPADPGEEPPSAAPVPGPIDVNAPPLLLPPVPGVPAVPPVPLTALGGAPGPTAAVPEPWGTGAGEPLPVWLVQEPPVLLSAPSPVYPPWLRAAGVEGLVVVQLVVDTLGRAEPATVRVVQHDEAGFDAAAVAMVRASRFRPARVWGRGVRVLVRLPVTFRVR